jgi:hypothetical protein
MKEIFEQWLTARATAPGMLVCGVRQTDGRCLCHGSTRTFPPEQLEKILQLFAEANVQFPAESGRQMWHKWIFDEGQLCFVSRPDGSLLAMVVRPETDAAQNLGNLAGEFLALAAAVIPPA